MQLKNLTTKVLGRKIFFYRQIDSTQKEIHRRIENNSIQNGTVIYANIQTNGIGTHGRTWYTDEENNIAFSMYIEPNCTIEKLEGLTRKIAEIIVNIFKSKYEINLDIKEPNDIYCKGKKLGGILTETKIIEKDKVKHLIVGIGINTCKKEFKGELENIATSIINEFSIKTNNEEFILEFCNEFEKEIIKRMENNENRIFISGSGCSICGNG